MFYGMTSLGRVAQHSESNKMDAHNLAVVFGPTLLRIPSEQDMIAYQSQVNGMIELLIKHCDEIFPGSGESLPAPLSETEESESEEGKCSEWNDFLMPSQKEERENEECVKYLKHLKHCF